MNLFAKTFRPLQSFLQACASRQNRRRRSPSSGPVPRHRFRPGVEALEARALPDAGLSALHHPPLADARMAPAAHQQFTVAVFDGTYVVTPVGNALHFPAFNVTVSDGVITVPSQFQAGGVTVTVLSHKGSLTLDKVSKALQRVSATVSGDFNLVAVASDGTYVYAQGNYSGMATFVFGKHRHKPTTATGFVSVTVTFPSGTTTNISGGWNARRM